MCNQPDVQNIPMKKCNKGDKCVHSGGPIQPLDNFSGRRLSPDGKSYTCKECERLQSRESYKRRKEKGLIDKTDTAKEIRRQYSKDYYRDKREERLEYYRKYRNSERGRSVYREGAKRRDQRKNDQQGDKYQRWEVIKRDTVDGKLICQLCNKPIERVRDVHIDHIVPIASGGIDQLDNVRCVHQTCNLERNKNE